MNNNGNKNEKELRYLINQLLIINKQPKEAEKFLQVSKPLFSIMPFTNLYLILLETRFHRYCPRDRDL